MPPAARERLREEIRSFVPAPQPADAPTFDPVSKANRTAKSEKLGLDLPRRVSSDLAGHDRREPIPEYAVPHDAAVRYREFESEAWVPKQVSNFGHFS